MFGAGHPAAATPCLEWKYTSGEDRTTGEDVWAAETIFGIDYEIFHMERTVSGGSRTWLYLPEKPEWCQPRKSMAFDGVDKAKRFVESDYSRRVKEFSAQRP